MGDEGAVGGGHGLVGVVGAGQVERQLMQQRCELLDILLKGNRYLSISNDDSLVIMYLEKSGRVDYQELKVDRVPDGYFNADEGMLQNIFSLVNLQQRIRVSRRRALFFRLIAIRGVRGLGPKDILLKETEAIKDFMHSKDEHSECYRKLKVKVSFVCHPDVFKESPELLEKQKK